MTSFRCALAMAFAIGAFGSGSAHAVDEYDTGMQRVKDCSLEASARQLTGDARQKFLSDCWAMARKSDMMRACDTRASQRQLAADARKAFLSDCLKER